MNRQYLVNEIDLIGALLVVVTLGTLLFRSEWFYPPFESFPWMQVTVGSIIGVVTLRLIQAILKGPVNHQTTTKKDDPHLPEHQSTEADRPYV